MTLARLVPRPDLQTCDQVVPIEASRRVLTALHLDEPCRASQREPGRILRERKVNVQSVRLVTVRVTCREALEDLDLLVHEVGPVGGEDRVAMLEASAD